MPIIAAKFYIPNSSFYIVFLVILLVNITRKFCHNTARVFEIVV